MKIKLYFLPIFLILFSCKEKKNKENYLFKKTESSYTQIDFKNNIKDTSEHSIINYIYYYNGGGVAAGDINNDGLPDLYFTSNKEKNKLYLNKGNFKFEDISKKANIEGKSDWNTGVSMIDINNDGFLDIYVCAVSGILDFEGQNELFINNGNGTFTERAEEFGLDFKGYSTQAYFFDYDKDNDLDVYIVNHATHTTRSHKSADARDKRVPLVGDVLFKNNNGKFEDVSEDANIYGGINGYGLSASIADFNNDGWDDIYVCNDFHEEDYYYLNNQDGTFREELSKSFSTVSRFSMGSDVADINGDGFQDLITLDMLPNDERVIKESEGDDAMYNMQKQLRNLGYKDQYSRNMLQINNNGEYFNETAILNEVEATDWSWSPLFADFNNDGHQDLFISNGINKRPNDLDFKKYVSNTFKNHNEKEGLQWLFKSINEMPSGKTPNMIFKGNSKKFSNKNNNWIEDKPSLSNGAIYSDLDLDGDLDIIINNVNEIASVYENRSKKIKNYISLTFEYLKGNKFGVGTKAIIYSNKKKQFKQLFNSKGFQSSIENKLHFGLDSTNIIDSIKIIWPNNKFQKINSPKINQTLIIPYSTDSKHFKYRSIPKNLRFNENKIITFSHQEDSYYDPYYEKLIPYSVSSLGPAFAVGDIDKNGFDDIFIGNSSGKKAQVYLNNGTSLYKKEFSDIDSDLNFEDNDAAFFDADGDGDLDLYVASGINSERNLNFEMDRLYINENGDFKRSKNKILYNPLNTSCVKPYDYDNDGDIDIFLGNLSNPGEFGANVNSAILKNDGKGNFTPDTNFIFKSKVTNAEWSDINNDGTKDLIITTEWDEPKIYINSNGKLSLKKIPENLKGLWQSTTVFDIDKDGDHDVLLGNWGLNTRFKASAENPLLMYYGDFDNNQKKETILAYSINGKYYPLNSKDELSSQMNIINKKFVEHKNFALKTVQEIFTDEALDKAIKFEATTLSSGYLENNNGEFTKFKKLPQEFQTAPINNFKKITLDNNESILVSGNTLKVNTYHGGYTAFKGMLLESNKKYSSVSTKGIKPFNSQIKKTEVLKMKNKNILFMISNNDSFKTYSFKK